MTKMCLSQICLSGLEILEDFYVSFTMLIVKEKEVITLDAEKALDKCNTHLGQNS